MAKLNIPYLSSKPGRGGATRWFWSPGPRLRAHGWRTQRLCPEVDAFGTEPPAAVIEQARAINRDVAAWAEGRVNQPVDGRVGTVAALIERYRRSPQFAAKAPKTQRSYDQNLDILDTWIGKLPVRAVTAAEVARFYDRIAPTHPSKAAHVIAVGRLLWSFGRRRGETEKPGPENPFERPDVAGAKPSGRLWSAAAVAAVAAAADRLGYPSVGTAVILNEWIGQRQGDILGLDRAVAADGLLTLTQSKTGVTVTLPVELVPHLVARLDEERARQTDPEKKLTATTLLVCEDTGRAWNEHHFRHRLAGIRAAAARDCPEAAGLLFMWLRHTAVTRLAEAGCTDSEIAAVTGHSAASIRNIIERYRVRTKKLAAHAFAKRLADQAASEQEGEG